MPGAPRRGTRFRCRAPAARPRMCRAAASSEAFNRREIHAARSRQRRDEACDGMQGRAPGETCDFLVPPLASFDARGVELGPRDRPTHATRRSMRTFRSAGRATRGREQPAPVASRRRGRPRGSCKALQGVSEVVPSSAGLGGGAGSAGQGVDGIERLQLAIDAKPELRKAPGCGQYLLLERTHRLVERIDAPAERLAEPCQMLAETPQAACTCLRRDGALPRRSRRARFASSRRRRPSTVRRDWSGSPA